MLQSGELDCPARKTALVETPALEIICTVARRSLVHRYRGVPVDAVHDAVQEAACKLYEQGTLRTEANPRTVYSWIHTTASRELGHSLRRQSRGTISISGSDHGTLGGDSTSAAVRADDTATVVQDDQLNDMLTYHALLCSLSPNLAEAVRLHLEGYTADEIAERLGCTRAAAYKRVQRGCFELRELWRKEEGRVKSLTTA